MRSSLAILRYKEVAGLQIAMNYASSMRLIERISELGKHLAQQRRLHRPAGLHILLKCLTLSQVHREKGDAAQVVCSCIENIDNVRVLSNSRTDLGLLDEEIDQLRVRDEMRMH